MALTKLAPLVHMYKYTDTGQMYDSFRLIGLFDSSHIVTGWEDATCVDMVRYNGSGPQLSTKKTGRVNTYPYTHTHTLGLTLWYKLIFSESRSITSEAPKRKKTENE